MKKLLALFLVSVLFLLTMTGCHGAKRRDAFVIPEEWDETRQYEISFWAKSDTNVTQTRIYEKAIRDFEALYPNIKVNLKIFFSAFNNHAFHSCLFNEHGIFREERCKADNFALFL